MDTQPCRASQDLSRAIWTKELTEMFANLLVEQVVRGNRSNGVFSKEAWMDVIRDLKKQTGFKFSQKQLKNRFDVLKKQYTITKTVLDQSEFRWDESQEMVLANEDVWAKYIKVNPDAKSIKKRGSPHFKLLISVFSESEVNGQELSYKTIPDLVAGGEDDQDELDQDQSRAKWTETLDKLFTDLMVERTVQGKKTNSSFSWKYIHNEFNKQTGLNFNMKQLINRRNVLKAVYDNVKSLLDQDGFSWDETNSMVVADDELWEKHISGNPEVAAIKKKGCFLYKQLCQIFSESRSGMYTQSSQDSESDKVEDGVETDCSLERPEAENVFVNPSTPSPSARDEASSRKVSARKNKRSSAEPPKTGNKKRSCTTRLENSAPEGIREMGSTSRSMITKLVQSVDEFSISNCVKVLNEIQGVDQDLYLAALDLLEDPIRRETFISIRSDIRLAWLKGKCNLPF